MSRNRPVSHLSGLIACASCLLPRVRVRERSQEVRRTRPETGSIRHETQGTRQNIRARHLKCHHCHVARRSCFSGGGEPAVQKSAVAGGPPGVPGNGPRIRASPTGAYYRGPSFRALAAGRTSWEKSRRTNEQNVPFRTTLGTRQRSSKCCPEGPFGPLDALYLGHLPRALWTTQK